MPASTPDPGPTPCSGSNRAALFALLAVAASFAVSAVMLPQVRDGLVEAFTAAPGDAGDSGVPGDGPAVQLVHARWCGHCRSLLKRGGPWQELKAALPGVRFTELDEARVEGAAAVKRYGVEAFPDIRVVDAGRNSVALYDGPRELRPMRAWVLDNAHRQG